MFSDETMATGNDNFWREKVILFPDKAGYNVCHSEDEQFLPFRVFHLFACHTKYMHYLIK